MSEGVPGFPAQCVQTRSGQLIAIDPVYIDYAQNPLRPDIPPCQENEQFKMLRGRDKLLALEGTAMGAPPTKKELRCIGYFEVPPGTYEIDVTSVRRAEAHTSGSYPDTQFSASSGFLLLLDPEYLDEFLQVFDWASACGPDKRVDQLLRLKNSRQIGEHECVYALLQSPGAGSGVEYVGDGEYFLSTTAFRQAVYTPETLGYGTPPMQRSLDQASTITTLDSANRSTQMLSKSGRISVLPAEEEPKVLFEDHDFEKKSDLKLSHRPEIEELAPEKNHRKKPSGMKTVMMAIRNVFAEQFGNSKGFRYVADNVEGEPHIRFLVPENWVEICDEGGTYVIGDPEGELPQLFLENSPRLSKEEELGEFLMAKCREFGVRPDDQKLVDAGGYEAIQCRYTESDDLVKAVVGGVAIDVEKGFIWMSLKSDDSFEEEHWNLMKHILESLSS